MSTAGALAVKWDVPPVRLLLETVRAFGLSVCAGSERVLLCTRERSGMSSDFPVPEEYDCWFSVFTSTLIPVPTVVRAVESPASS
jgi:hypothetical protein